MALTRLDWHEKHNEMFCRMIESTHLAVAAEPHGSTQALYIFSKFTWLRSYHIIPSYIILVEVYVPGTEVSTSTYPAQHNTIYPCTSYTIYE